MLTPFIMFAQASALMVGQTAAPAAPVAAARGLKDLPNTTTTYYDVRGKNGAAIDRALKKLLNDPASKPNVQLYAWNVGAQIIKRTEGDKCTVAEVKATMTNQVRLPRLVEEAQVPAQVVASWRTYVASIEREAAANLWFINDRLRGVEQALLGLPCDQATPAWDAGLGKIKTELAGFVAQQAAITNTVPKKN